MDDAFSISMAEVRDLLGRALSAIVSGDVGALELFTEDVVVDSPNMVVRSRTELEYQLIDRTGVLSNVEFSLERVDEVGPDLVATWSVSGDHTGELLVNEDELFEPSGRRIELTATTHARLRGRRVCSFRTSYDDGDLMDQLRARPSPDAS